MEEPTLITYIGAFIGVVLFTVLFFFLVFSFFWLVKKQFDLTKWIANKQIEIMKTQKKSSKPINKYIKKLVIAAEIVAAIIFIIYITPSVAPYIQKLADYLRSLS